MHLRSVLASLAIASFTVALPTYNGTSFQPIASFSTALPIDNGTFPLIFTWPPIKAPTKDVICGPPGNQQKYTAQQVKTAVNAAKSLMKKGKTIDNYPHEWKGHDAAVFGAMPQECKHAFKYWEFPILPSGSFTPKTDPGPDRVLIAQLNDVTPHAPTVFTYCIAITHRGKDFHEFRPCTDA